MAQCEDGKQYWFYCGRHSAIVQKKGDKLQYLELQSSVKNGWKDFDGNVGYTLNTRFGCTRSSGRTVHATMIDIDEFKDSKDFDDILGYINTKKDKQKKGAGGYAK